MSITDYIDSSVYGIRHAVQSIRDSIDTSEIDSDLDSIENECDELLNLETDAPNSIISNALDDNLKSYKTIDNCSKKQYICNSIVQEIGK